MKYVNLLIIVLLLPACGWQKQTMTPPSTSPLTMLEIDGHFVKTEDGQRLLIPSLKDKNQSTFFLVRHAEKEEGGSDPMLSEIGVVRAERLGHIFRKLGLDGIYSSDYYRTKDTCKPTANQHKMDITIYNVQDQTASFEHFKELGHNKKMLVVGHSNTIPALLNYLTQTEEYPTMPHEQYDRLFIVSLTKIGEAEVFEMRF